MLGTPHRALRTRATTFAGLVLMALALIPTTALAQSAGDEQYADPLAQRPDSSPAPSSPAPSSGAQDDSGSGTAPASPQAPTPVAEQSADATAAQQAPGAKPLPRTGVDVAPIALAGAGLLTGGLLLLALAGPARNRRRRDPVMLFDGTLPPLR